MNKCVSDLVKLKVSRVLSESKTSGWVSKSIGLPDLFNLVDFPNQLVYQIRLNRPLKIIGLTDSLLYWSVRYFTDIQVTPPDSICMIHQIQIFRVTRCFKTSGDLFARFFFISRCLFPSYWSGTWCPLFSEARSITVLFVHHNSESSVASRVLFPFCVVGVLQEYGQFQKKIE